jgi:hypothetical protein
MSDNPNNGDKRNPTTQQTKGNEEDISEAITEETVPEISSVPLDSVATSEESNAKASKKKSRAKAAPKAPVEPRKSTRVVPKKPLAGSVENL